MGTGRLIESNTVRVEEGGGEVEGGGGGTHKVYGKNVRRALKLNNFADIGATDFIFASFSS